MASIEVKQISSSCKTRMRVSVSVYEKYANHCFRRSVLTVCMTWKWAVYAIRKNLWSWKHAASMGLWHASMHVSAGLSDAYATLSLLARLFLCCGPDPATETCGQRNNRKAGSSPCCQVAKHFAKNPSKGDVKNLFWPRKIRPVMAVPLAYLRVFVYHFSWEV